MRRKRTTLAIGDVTAELFNTVEPGNYAPITQLRLAWQGICGADLSAHSDPFRLEDTTLVISVRTATWADALLNIQASLISQCQTVVPELRSITTVLRPGETQALESEAIEATPTAATRDIEHDELRASLDGLLAAVESQRNRSGGDQ